MTVNLSDLLNPACIELNLKSKKKPDVLKELTAVIARSGSIGDLDKLYEELLKREALASTGIGRGIAIPHCLTSQVKNTIMGFGRKLEGIKFDAVDDEPVTLFFLLVGPERYQYRQLQALSRLARYLHDQKFCDELLSANSVEAVIDAFKRKEEV
jgi:fructose-specific phosphotransferase system IIA component